MKKRNKDKKERSEARVTGLKEGAIQPGVAYLPQLVERCLVHTALLKVVLRRENHLADDLLVDGALDVTVSGFALA
jgi:hypothetical protein